MDGGERTVGEMMAEAAVDGVAAVEPSMEVLPARMLSNAASKSAAGKGSDTML